MRSMKPAEPNLQSLDWVWFGMEAGARRTLSESHDADPWRDQLLPLVTSANAVITMERLQGT